MNNEKFVNPYNFIKLKTNKTTSKLERGNLTGYLDVTIETKTPIFIPNTTNEHYFANDFPKNLEKSYDFYSYEDLRDKTDTKILYSPVIPSSEIRGTIRSVFEAANNGCLSSIDLEERFFERTRGDGSTPHIVRNNGNGEYEIFQTTCKPSYKDKALNNIEVESISFKDNKKIVIKHEEDEFENYSEVFYDEESNEIFYPEEQFPANAILVVGERHPKGRNEDKEENLRHSVKVFMLPHEGEQGQPFDISLLSELLKSHGDAKINNNLLENNQKKSKKNHTGYSGLDLNASYIPVYASDDLKSVSFAKRGKYTLYNKVKDVISNYAPCTSKDDLCDACAIFGFINESEEKNSLTSRVRFIDAVTSIDSSKCYMDKFIIKPMLSPHISNGAFYSTKTSLTLTSYDDQNAIIRGRKFYLHHKPVAENYICKDSEFFRLTKAIRPVKENIEFTTKIYFENLTEEQLQKLIYSVELSDDEHGQKIGAGKAYGFGSINMKLNDCVIRELTIKNNKITYDLKSITYDKLDYEQSDIGELEFLTRLEPFKDQKISIHYPPGGFEWFANNYDYINAKNYKQLLSRVDELKKNIFLNKKNEKPRNGGK